VRMGRDLWWSPTIRCAVVAGTPWLNVHCPGCGTRRMVDVRMIDRHPLASVGKPRVRPPVHLVPRGGPDALRSWVCTLIRRLEPRRAPGDVAVVARLRPAVAGHQEPALTEAMPACIMRPRRLPASSG